MRQRFFPQTLIVSLCLILCVVVSAQAQSTYIPITSNNVAQISQIQRIGNGIPKKMAFSPDGSRLAVATTLGIWMIDVPVGARHASPVLFEGQGGAESLTFSPDGSKIAAGGEDNSVMIFDAATDKPLERLTNHIYPISAVAWSSDGKWIASGDWSGVVRLWDTANWSEYRVLTINGRVDALNFEQSDTQVTALNGSTVTRWNVDTGVEVDTESGFLGSEGFGYALNPNGFIKADWSPDDGTIAVVPQQGKSSVFDGFYGELGDVFFTADSRVGASPLKSTYIWSLDGKPDDKAPPVLSPDGSQLATFGNDGVIHLKNGETQVEIAALHGHIRAVTGVAFSPDSKLLVSSSNDGTIQVWDATVTQDSGSLATLTGHNGGVSSVAFNADGTLIASAGYDGTVRLWGIKA